MNPIMLLSAEPGAASAMKPIIDAMADVFAMVGTVVTNITGQPVLLFCLAASLAGVGIGMFRKLKDVARG